MHLKLLVRYPFDIRRARRLLQSREDASGRYVERPVVLDLRTEQLVFDCGRHLQCLAHYAHLAGSPTLLRCSDLILSSVARKVFGREMLAQPYVRRIAKEAPLPDGSLVLADYEPNPDELSRMIAAGYRFWRMLIGREVDRSIPVMPYPMHPKTLWHLGRIDLSVLRNGDQLREVILFAGSQKRRYGDTWMEREFGILSRQDILDTLRDAFSNRVLESWAPVGAPDRIVLMDSQVFSIPASDWLPMLSRARFFVCCPGGRQPLCHNLIEAMSVGTIPLIEYGDRIVPALQDGETAICFRGRQGLVEAVRRIDRMPEGERSAMSRRVSAFYDRYLCGIRFMRDLRDGKIDSKTREICMPFHERNFFDRTVSKAA